MLAENFRAIDSVPHVARVSRPIAFCALGLRRTFGQLCSLPGLIFLLCCAVLISGCQKENKPAQPPKPAAGIDTTFTPPAFGSDRKLDTVLRVGLTTGSGPWYVVTSKSTLDSDEFAESRADLVQFYRFDSVARKYALALTDSIEDASNFDQLDVTGDGIADFVVYLESGGNDAIASDGMHIYSSDGGDMRRIFRSTWMEPELLKLPPYQGSVVLLHHELWPKFASHADVVSYVDDILAFRQGTYRSVTRVETSYFAAQADIEAKQARAMADSLIKPLGPKDSLDDESTIPLFMHEGLALIYYSKAGNYRLLNAFWIEQRNLLQSRMPAEQFDELCSMYIATNRPSE